MLGVTCYAQDYGYGVPGGRAPEPEAADDAGGEADDEPPPTDEDEGSLRELAGEYPPPPPLELLLLGSILLHDEGEGACRSVSYDSARE